MEGPCRSSNLHLQALFRPSNRHLQTSYRPSGHHPQRSCTPVIPPPVPDMTSMLDDSSSSSSDTDDGQANPANRPASSPELDRLPYEADSHKRDSENNAYEVGSSSDEDTASQDLYGSARKRGARVASKRTTQVMLSEEDDDDDNDDDGSQQLKRLKKATPDRHRAESRAEDGLATTDFEHTAEAHAMMAEDHSNQVDDHVTTPSRPLI